MKQRQFKEKLAHRNAVGSVSVVGLSSQRRDLVPSSTPSCTSSDQARDNGSPGSPSVLEVKYSRIYNSMRDAFVLVDMQGRLIEWNAAFIDLLGYSAEELPHLTYTALTPTKWHAIEAEIVDQQVIPHGESRLYEKEYLRKDGTIVPIELKTHLLRNDKGEPEAMWAIVRDISERKRIEVALREQEEFFRLIAENTLDYIAVLSVDGRRLYNSPSYAKFFGDPRYLLDTDSFAEIHPEDQARVKKVFAETVRTGIGQYIEYRFVLPDGAIRSMESRGGVIKDESGKVLRVVVVSNDITERKKAEEKIFHLAFYDSLTQLPNRRMLNDRMRQVIAASKRNGLYVGLIFLDLDNFKPLNDAHGHAVGDLLLCEAGRRIADCLREVDTVARFGGDEFVILLNDLDVSKELAQAKAMVVADKIRNCLTAPYALPIRQDGEKETILQHECTSSLGLVLFQGDSHSIEDLLRWADIAMYQAKSAGRNCVHLYDPSTCSISAAGTSRS
jgi:diguanylate cyclase (GGDEF)-like protein/PAS domain S-box-containing protein